MDGWLTRGSSHWRVSGNDPWPLKSILSPGWVPLSEISISELVVDTTYQMAFVFGFGFPRGCFKVLHFVCLLSEM